ncbi:uncharacterized protein RCC_02374 [Ramularia collo-cygni]|uniref:Uncharacterized protein n=1 Tax=Ramularia collo-cygni TaxID=112498 RepID=A0A2D3UUD4_9PEZI|nr:uncharacterized protein RCC_02374 [Ramularia collo-cygni]CZT16540.1 uncharacterized protein RCC_02374 [Ramularia collo-cygni]
MFTTTLRRNVLAPQSFALRQVAIPARNFQTSSIIRKEIESKDSINTESREYSKTGGDGAASQKTEDAAFNPDKTRPEEERESAKQQSGGEENDPLNVSPANPDISQARGAQEGGAMGSKSETGEGSERARSSGGGSPAKRGGGKSG